MTDQEKDRRIEELVRRRLRYPYNEEQFVSDIEAMSGADPEVAHGEADRLVEKLLQAEGFDRAIEALESLKSRSSGWWYA